MQEMTQESITTMASLQGPINPWLSFTACVCCGGPTNSVSLKTAESNLGMTPDVIWLLLMQRMKQRREDARLRQAFSRPSKSYPVGSTTDSK